MVDKNLFLYDLAVVAILKDEGKYLKEWLDYHLLAGVEHFYLYDNESTDNPQEIIKPYIEAGLVDYFYTPGKAMQVLVYNEAVKQFKFQCRYMAFIDLDEFIYPKTGGSITEVVDEILSRDSNAAGLSFHMIYFGSNGQERADYSRGVLERFTRRAQNEDEINQFMKNIVDPRKIKYFQHMHSVSLFKPFYLVNEKLTPRQESLYGLPVTAEKIVVNHYHVKSKEEYKNTKMKRGWPCIDGNPYTQEEFRKNDRNEVFDDGILKYRAVREKNFSLENDAQRFNRVIEALTETLSSSKSLSMETALTCRALSTYLRKKFPNDADDWKICEEASLFAIIKSFCRVKDAEALLLISDLPNILCLPYPVVREFLSRVLYLIDQMKDLRKQVFLWEDFVELDYLQNLLKTFKE